MELKWLEDFLSLAQTRSFSRSASERFCTQSAFSRRIKALETWLGAELINRSTFPTALTPAGLVFRDATEEILRLLFEVRDDLRGRLGWLPESLIANDLERGEVVIAGNAAWQTEVEVRLYRSAEHPKSLVESIWTPPDTERISAS